jgi:hypothetical protein
LTTNAVDNVSFDAASGPEVYILRRIDRHCILPSGALVFAARISLNPAKPGFKAPPSLCAYKSAEGRAVPRSAPISLLFHSKHRRRRMTMISMANDNGSRALHGASYSSLDIQFIYQTV